MIDLALHYAKSGWPVFPLKPSGKKPCIPKRAGGRGCHDATTSIAKIEQWWNIYPDANIGIATGKRSGLLVVDIDPRKTHSWLASVNELCLPHTFTVRTASRGFHIYVDYPIDSSITIGSNLLPGIDWRGEGGYVVAAGSVVHGVTYEIVRNCAIAPAPAHLIERIRAGRKCARPVDKAGHMVIPSGSRNETLFAMASLLRRFGVEYSAIYESLRATNDAHCDPPLAELELQHIASSVMRYSPQRDREQEDLAR